MHFSYAPHFELFDHTLAIQPALEVGVFQHVEKTFFIAPDGSSSTYPGPYPSIPFSGYTKSNIDFSGGLLFFTKRFYGGIAIHHINRPEYTHYIGLNLPIRFTLHTGANLAAGNFILSPTILMISQEDYNYIQLGLRAKYKILTFGLDVAVNTIIPEIGLQNRFFKLSYCYSYVNDRFVKNPGTHELHFNWHFKHKNKKQLSLRMI